MLEEKDLRTFRVIFLCLITAIICLVSTERAVFAAEVVDQSNLPEWAGGWTHINPDPNGQARMWQTFTPDYSNITAVEIDILTVNPGDFNDLITIEIAKEGEILASTEHNVEYGFEGLLRFEFDETVPVIPGELYELKVHDTGLTRFGWKYASNTYDAGTRYVSASERPGTDWFFRTYSLKPHILYVDDDAAGANNGSSWENAYVYLQDALADANSTEKPVEIRVAQGIYRPNQRMLQTPGDGDNTFTLINEVTLKGGYAGFDKPDPNARNWDLYKSVLSGDLNGDDVEVEDPCDMLLIESHRSDNSPVVVRAYYTDATTVLDGFVITGGCFMDMYTVPSTGGAGMHIYQGSPTILNCTFTGNAAYYIGGGLLNRCGSNPTLVNCAFTGNYAGSGGGIYNNSNMSAPWTISEKSHPTLVSCTFDNNYALKNGGGMYNSASNPTLIDCTFYCNQITGPYSGSTRGSHTGGGGGIYNSNSNPILTNCLFSENSAGDGGGTCNVADSNVTLTDCTFNGNLASDRGGGLSNLDDCNLTMTNCLIVGNWAEFYGGGIQSKSELTLSNCTIVGNRTNSYDGGGIYFQVGRISNSIIYGNITPRIEGSEIAQGPHGQAGCRPELIKVTHSVVGSDPNAFDIPSCYSGEWLYANPLFANPGYWDANDTPDDPNDDFWIDGDYHLKSQAGRWDPASQSWIQDDVTSPCIDAGDPNSPVGDEPFPNGGIINMGAYGGTAEASKSFTSELFQASPGLIRAYGFKSGK
jgi:hypothetical protein